MFLIKKVLNMGGNKNRKNLERFNFVKNVLKIDEYKIASRKVDYLLWGME